MSGAYDDVLLSPLSFSTMIKHLTENVSWSYFSKTISGLINPRKIKRMTYYSFF